MKAAGNLGGQQFGSSNDHSQFSYSIGINAFYSGAACMQPRVARANLNAVKRTSPFGRTTRAQS